MYFGREPQVEKCFIYVIDVATSSIRLLKSMVTQWTCIDFDAQGDLLADLREENNSYYLHVNKIAMSADGVDEGVMLDLGKDPVCVHHILQVLLF